jgi:hypothetical protein
VIRSRHTHWRSTAHSMSWAASMNGRALRAERNLADSRARLGLSAYLGATFTDAGKGARATEVLAEGPAHVAGLLPGDVVGHIGNIRVRTGSDIDFVVRTWCIPGDTTLFRCAGRPCKTVLVALTEQPEPPADGGTSQCSNDPAQRNHRRSWRTCLRTPTVGRSGKGWAQHPLERPSLTEFVPRFRSDRWPVHPHRSRWAALLTAGRRPRACVPWTG